VACGSGLDAESAHSRGPCWDIEWSRIEPSEGNYDLDWLERAINAAGAHGIYTVLSTATAAPPQWLTEKYPQALRTKEDGSKSRVTDWDINFDDAKYRELCHEIASRLAQRFGHNPYVIGWQIDNEIRKPRSTHIRKRTSSSGSRTGTRRSTI